MSEEKYTVYLKGDAEIKISKNLLDQFPAIKTRPSTSLLIDYSNTNYTLDSFTLITKVAQIIYDEYARKTNNTLPENLNFAIKAQIMQELEKAPLADVLICSNFFFYQQASEAIQKFFNTESNRLLKRFISKEEGNDIDLSNIDLSEQTMELKKEVIDIFASSDQVITFSQKNIHLNLPNTKDKEIMEEVMVPHGDMYAYILANDKKNYLILLSKNQIKQLEKHTFTTDTSNGIYGLYAAQRANGIVSLMGGSGDIVLYTLSTFFTNEVEIRKMLQGSAFVESPCALSADGRFFLYLFHPYSSYLEKQLAIYDFYNEEKPKTINADTYIGATAYRGDPTNTINDCCFNPTDSDTFLFYGAEKIFFTTGDHVINEINFANIGGKIVKTLFSNDGSYVYIIIHQKDNLFCYKYYYFQPIGFVKHWKAQLNYDRIVVKNVVNSPDGEQLFVECLHSSIYREQPQHQEYHNLYRFDFKTGLSTILYSGEGQSFDLKSDGNLIVFKTKNRIHFYDCFFQREVNSFSIERCRRLLGFSADGSLWLRMEAAPISVMSKKSSEDYLLCYKIREQGKVKAMSENINKNFDLTECLELLTEQRISRTNWDQKLHEMAQDWYKKAYEAYEKKKFAKLQYQRKKRDKLEKRKKQKQLSTTMIASKNIPVQRIMPLNNPPTQPISQQIQQQLTQQVQQPTSSALPPQLPLPKPTFTQRAWSAVQGAVDWIAAKIVTPFFRWFGFIS